MDPCGSRSEPGSASPASDTGTGTPPSRLNTPQAHSAPVDSTAQADPSVPAQTTDLGPPASSASASSASFTSSSPADERLPARARSSTIGRGAPPSMPPPPPTSSSTLAQPAPLHVTTTISSPGRRAPSGILQNPLPSSAPDPSGLSTSRLSSYSSVRTPAPTTDSDSIYSSDPDDQSDAYETIERGSRAVSRARASSSARGASAMGSSTGEGSGFKGKGPMPHPPFLRSSSLNPPRSRSKSRQRQSRAIDDEDEQDDDERPPMSPLISGRPHNPDLGGDDEVERRDRGEELVRQRMKDRARIKKEAEKATKKREADARAARFGSDSRRTSYAPGPTTPGLEFESSSQPLDRSFSGPGFSAPTARSRDPSRSGLRDSFSSDGTELGYTTDTPGGGGNSTIRAGVPASPISSVADVWPPATPLSPHFARRSSYSSTANGEDDTSEAGNVFADRPLSRAEPDRAEPEGDDALADGEGDEDEDEDEDLEQGSALEYTIKDRQDAINIEHPFGLPIWKPALYKKSRSVTRNAETALHATPSSIALRHLAPGNILWTIFFGVWLFLICALVGAVLWCVPWGGEKYGRVIWELGGYLVWPFGKYVEGWSDGDDDSVDSDVDRIDEEDEDALDLDDDDEPSSSQSTPHDLEQAGRTFGRSERSASARPSSHVNDLFDQHGDGSLPDEPRRNERAPLLASSPGRPSYGASTDDKATRSSSEDTIAVTRRPHDFTKDRDGKHAFRVRALGRSMYWVGFYLVVAPVMLVACILCWAMVFTIPMAKLLWVLLRHLNNEPLALHFRSPPTYTTPPPTDASDTTHTPADEVQYPLRAGQRAPRVSRQSVRDAKAHGRLFGPRSTVLLCTYRAAGLQYYKYTIDGVNILFINLLSLVFFTIADFIWIAPWVDKHHVGGILGALAGHGAIFLLALLSVIPLSYFIGMAVASISAQSSIGMGAVINASFGSIIEIILYCIALTQSKADLVEGSIVGSLLAAVLLMPGLSMIGGAMRRKEQRFNAKSAGVTSTMLIMAIIGILTPTLFYEIYGSFTLICTGCDPDPRGTTTSCKTCYYEHVDPVDDPFYKTSVRLLSFWCAGILVLSYLIGLWFSLRTHASQIWQNAQSSHDLPAPRPLTTHLPADRTSLYKRALPGQLLAGKLNRDSIPGASPSFGPRAGKDSAVPAIELPQGLTAEDLSRVYEVAHVTADALQRAQPPPIHRQASHVREVSKVDEEDGHGGHDAPNWSRFKSASVLMGCTVLYAIIAEILVDMVDVVLDGSGIPEKFLGVTLFALVPNTTEFMNAISFAINGNIALSLEIGSAYALQVCLIQAPVMLAFSAFYGIGKESLLHQAFTLVFPRWDVIAIIFSVFLLTYTYLEARANYYKGSILCLSYLVLIGGFAFAPASNPSLPAPGSLDGFAATPSLSGIEHLLALWRTLFSH